MNNNTKESKEFECCNCKWKGNYEDKERTKVNSYTTILTCPECGCDDFYRNNYEMQV